MAKFLPREAGGVTYAIKSNASTHFAGESASFLQEVATKMSVEATKDVGRIPSVMSPAYNFYIDLFPELFAAGANPDAAAGDAAQGRIAARPGRIEAYLRARQSLRGIVTALALRDVLGLDIRLTQFNPLADAGPKTNLRYRQAFARAYSETPSFGRDEPGRADSGGDEPGRRASRAAWLTLRYLVVRTPISAEHYVDEPLCGLSPYTLFFPAATSMKWCNTIFWYDNAEGRWLDPTTTWTNRPDLPPPPIAVGYEVIRAIRGYMAAWLNLVIEAAPHEIWTSFGMEGPRAVRLQAELSAWLDELRRSDPADPPRDLRVEPQPLGLNVRRGAGLANVPLLEQKMLWGAPPPPPEAGRGVVGKPVVFPGLVCELPRVSGRVLLSKSILSDPKVRICGWLMGKEGLYESLSSQDDVGERFVLKDGNRTYVICEPYVIVDRLMLDTLHLLADGPISRSFFAMSTSGSVEEHWLYPFRPKLLRYLDIETLRAREAGGVVTCRRLSGQNTDIIEVTVLVGGFPIVRQYGKDQRKRDAAGNTLDIRIWPNFRFHCAPPLPEVDADRVHYFRIRQQAAWDLHTQIVARQAEGGDDVKLFFAESNWDPGWPEQLEPTAFRLACCYAFPATGGRTVSDERLPDGTAQGGQWEPVGLSFADKGVCLFRLIDPQPVVGGQVSPMRVGTDFGTSNTCVAEVVATPGIAAQPREVRFEMQTATLHTVPTYEDVAEAEKANLDTEGAAAALDFTYNYMNEPFVADGAYFPTQLTTRLGDGAVPVDNAFHVSNGLIFPRNLIDNKDILALLRGYPPPRMPDHRPFRLVPDPKWKHREYRKTFLWHLYKMVVYHAARNGARIAGAAFSFPRAFTKNDVDRFRNELLSVFHNHGQIDRASIEIMTESDAVHQWMANQPPNYEPLVFDVGGGTCDILGVFQNQRFQASYELAARFVNQYFTASPRLEKALLDAIVRVVPLAPAGTPKGNAQRSQRRLLADLIQAAHSGVEQAADYREQAFFRMLGMLDDAHYPGVVNALQQVAVGAQNQADGKAIKGFFYTLTLLYCGLVYQAGKLMRQEGIMAANIGVLFIGNGSRFYQFLENQAVPFSKVIQGVFASAREQNPDIRFALQPEGKTLVAKGLLIDQQGRAPVRPRVVPDAASHQSLLELAGKVNPEPPMEPNFPELEAFMDALNRQLPGGTLDGSMVIPNAEGNLADEMKGLYRYIVNAVHGNEVRRARSLKDDMDQVARLEPINQSAAAPFRDSANASEPQFITRLKCLLDFIRERYANPAN
jgi:hypothetical protein